MNEEPYPVSYIFMNKSLQMSSGKAGAQCHQAGMGGYLLSEPRLQALWWKQGGHHTTLVMEARDQQTLNNIRDYLDERGFKSFMMIDEGMTEINAHTKTALGVELVDKNDVHSRKTFESFKLYHDVITNQQIIDRGYSL